MDEVAGADRQPDRQLRALRDLAKGVVVDHFQIARIARQDRFAHALLVILDRRPVVRLGVARRHLPQHGAPDAGDHVVDADRVGDVVQEIDQHRHRQQRQPDRRQHRDLWHEPW